MKYIIFCLLLIFTTIACEDIIEEDVSLKTIKINNPPDKFFSTNSTVTFWWDDLNKVDNYKIQVVRGRFDSVVKFVVDSTIAVNRFEFTFDPGEYEWRLRGQNSISSTEYIKRSFIIDSNNNLSNVSVILISPLGGISSNTSKTFKWNPVSSVTSYVVEIKEASWNNGNSVYKDTLNAQSLLLEDFFDSKKYVWGVKGINSTSETPFSTASFEIDTIKPNAPILNSPQNQTTTPLIGPSVTFYWSRGNDDNSDRDSIYIYSNPSLTNTVSRGVSIGETYTDSLSSGTYYWRVKSIDKVNNIGSFSEDWVFRVL